MYRLILCTLLGLLVASCHTGRPATDTEQAHRATRSARGANTVEVEAATTGVDLTSYLRQVAGVMVRGEGPSATIRVRGGTAYNADTSPLFVVDGTVLGNNFSSVYNAVDINDIARVTVLKTTSETNRYGMQGANGVIEIRMKN
ncbi:TonB-dependent receptor plug domain-containing protein [Lewinella sp. IMCC34183]|uniref:TonB-dependent receptor plug domain-containing protein n=1 Tax=Lewinella sp. IMCC34183 TaxID=2248762 RepID=UPI000E26BFE0|nr:TonB-dependent receptor plug domain-containing protein [Lewinella sp. IMCC34183]